MHIDIKKYAVAILFIMVVSPCLAEDRIEMDGITVIGNKESPNQLYIVPWESSELEDMAEPGLPASFMEESASSIDRNVMLRKLLLNKDNSK